jgi:succinyl-diaminopimelate desuccinylase
MPIDLLPTARALIAIDSRSSLSDRAIVDYLSPLCSQVGLEVMLQSECREGVRQFNLVATRKPNSEPGTVAPAPLLLATHLDTVPPGDHSLWTATGGDPYQLAEHDGALFGLGVADVKLDFLCKLLALERLRDVALRRPVVLAGTYGEEVGRWGASLLTRSMSTLPAAALVGEPTGLRTCTAHKGYVEIHCRAEAPAKPLKPGSCWSVRFAGAAAHSSQPHKGSSANDACLDALDRCYATGEVPVIEARGGEVVNTVAAAAELIVRCAQQPDLAAASVIPTTCPGAPAWSPELVRLLLAIHRSTVSLRDDLSWYPLDGFDPPFSTVNNGLMRLSAGSMIHTADVRRVAGEAPRAALEAHLERLGQLQADRRWSLGVDCKLEAAPFAVAEDSRLLSELRTTLAERHLPTTPELKSGTTEATVYAQAGMDVVVFGPGVAAGNIHRPNEHVPVADLHSAVEIYEALIRRMCC